MVKKVLEIVNLLPSVLSILPSFFFSPHCSIFFLHVHSLARNSEVNLMEMSVRGNHAENCSQRLFAGEVLESFLKWKWERCCRFLKKETWEKGETFF